jgi:aminoglycoside 3-N-acetyltransferase I
MPDDEKKDRGLPEARIEILEPSDTGAFRDLISLFGSAFGLKDPARVPEQQLQQLLATEDFFAVVARIDKKIVGGLTAYVLAQYLAPAPLVYLYDLAVAADYQRLGIGRSLVSHTLAYAKTKGYAGVFVQAEKTDAGALAFYRSTGATALEVLHFNYPLIST